jgi:hypothetical protein
MRTERQVRTVRAKATIDDTIAAIAKHSSGVTWHDDSAGLALILTADGYALTAHPEAHQTEALPERVLIPKEDGSPMSNGHKLTHAERERAVRAILCGTLDRRTAASEPTSRQRSKEIK